MYVLACWILRQEWAKRSFDCKICEWRVWVAKCDLSSSGSSISISSGSNSSIDSTSDSNSIKLVASATVHYGLFCLGQMLATFLSSFL